VRSTYKTKRYNRVSAKDQLAVTERGRNVREALTRYGHQEMDKLMTQSLVRDNRIGEFSSMAPPRLARIVSSTVQDSDQWLRLVRYDPISRWYTRLERTDDYEIWLLSWLPGQQTGFHDHGSSAGAFAVTLGSLCERGVRAGRPQPSARRVVPGDLRAFGPSYLHDVRNAGPGPAVSIHAYSPPLSSMRRFEVSSGGRLRAVAEERSW